MSTYRRDLVLTVAACAAGAALTLLALGRTWTVVVTLHPAPLPPTREARGGGSIAPWLTALSLVGLAGAGALLATRAWARRLVGALLLVVGVGMAAVALDTAAGTAHVRWAWPVLCLVGGVGVAYAGVAAFLRGDTWPAMGTRYERPASEPVEYVERSGPSRSDVAMWDALDRGEDPTRRGD